MSYIVIATLVACAFSFVTRCGPLFLPERYVDTPLLAKLSRHLPASILVLLAAYAFHHYSVWAYPYAVPELGAAAAAIVVHLWQRSLFFSLAVGIATNQWLTHLMAS